MLYLVGLGLGDPTDITVKGLEIVRKASFVYLEAYTSILIDNKEELSTFYGKNIIVADREFVEQGAEEILEKAKSTDVALLVVGDPFGATTHTDLVLRAKQLSIPYKVVHNASILNAVGACGLQLYSFGETVSIPLWSDTWKPTSWFTKISDNHQRGLHTLCLLDIKVKEPNLESMVKGKMVYDPPRFMTVSEAAKQLMDTIVSSFEDPGAIDKSTICIGVARIGSPTQQIVTATIEELVSIDIGPPLHSLVICGNLHPLEAEFIEEFKRK